CCQGRRARAYCACPWRSDAAHCAIRFARNALSFARCAVPRRCTGRLRSSRACTRMVAFGLGRRVSATLSESARAGDPRVSVWVSAHAGTGKTYTLANRVPRLLLDGARPSRILCLTYTKAAAAEMAGRLFAQLGEWAMLDDATLAANIEGIGAGCRTGEDLRRARRLFALALETPGGLKIQTIHAFCQYLLARFPLEAGVSPAFEVLDEATSRELIAAARAHVFERAAEGEQTL